MRTFSLLVGAVALLMATPALGYTTTIIGSGHIEEAGQAGAFSTANYAAWTSADTRFDSMDTYDPGVDGFWVDVPQPFSRALRTETTSDTTPAGLQSLKIDFYGTLAKSSDTGGWTLPSTFLGTCNVFALPGEVNCRPGNFEECYYYYDPDQGRIVYEEYWWSPQRAYVYATAGLDLDVNVHVDGYESDSPYHDSSGMFTNHCRNHVGLP